MTAAAYTVARYLIAWASGWLVSHGWGVAAIDGATTDAVTQIVVGVIGLVVPTTIGVLTGSVKWMLARLADHHKPALVAKAVEVQATPAPATGAP